MAGFYINGGNANVSIGHNEGIVESSNIVGRDFI